MEFDVKKHTSVILELLNTPECKEYLLGLEKFREPYNDYLTSSQTSPALLDGVEWFLEEIREAELGQEILSGWYSSDYGIDEDGDDVLITIYKFGPLYYGESSIDNHPEYFMSESDAIDHFEGIFALDIKNDPS